MKPGMSNSNSADAAGETDNPHSATATITITMTTPPLPDEQLNNTSHCAIGCWLKN